MIQSLRKSLFVSIAGFLGVGAAQAADEAKPATDPKAKPKITFEEHIQPIFREHCLSCHNQNEAKSDLALDTYARTMQGGAGGEVVIAGDLESSRLYALVAHTETPKMPPEQERIATAKVDLLKEWILTGALESSGSKVRIKPKVDLSLAVTTGNKPATPAVPEHFWRQPFTATTRPGASTAIATSPWAPLAAVAGQKQIMLYDTDKLSLLTILSFPEGLPHVLKFSRDGSVLLAGGGRGGASGKVVLFDVKTGKRITEVGDELDVVLAADVRNDLSLVALGGPKKMVRVYSVADGSLKYEMKKHTDWINAIEFSPDGRFLATADRSAGLMIWEAAAGQEYQNLTGHTNAITDLSWRSDSRLLATASEDATVKLWNIEQGKMLKGWPANRGALTVDFAMNGKLVSGGRDLRVKLWDIEGKALAETPDHADMVLDAAVTHDGNRIITGDWSGACNVYDAATGKLLGALSLNPLPLEKRVAFAAQQAEEMKKAAATAAAEAAAAKQALDAQHAEVKAAQEKANFVAAEFQRLDALRPKLEKEVPGLQRATAALAKRVGDLRRAADAAKAEEKQAQEAVAKADAKSADQAKKLLVRAQEKARELNDAATKAAAEASKADVAARDAGKALGETQKKLAELRGQLKPSKEAADKAVAATSAVEKAHTEKSAVAAAAAEAATAAEQAAQQAVIDKAEFDKQNTQARAGG